MGRKTSRDLWTAKLAVNSAAVAAAGDSSAVQRGKKAPGLAAGSSAAAHPTGRAQVFVVNEGGRTPPQSLPRVKQSAAALQRSAQAAYGVRAPFHGIVLGIDPSLRGTGIAVVRFSPPEQPRLLFSQTVRNKPALTPAQCLGAIARAVTEALETYRPTCIALEQTVYVQNVKTSLTLGSARGAAIAPAAMQGLEIFEYAPTRLKQAVVGSGRASKEQVAAMVKSLLQAGRDLLPSDEADAAAAAICHAFTTRT